MFNIRWFLLPTAMFNIRSLLFLSLLAVLGLFIVQNLGTVLSLVIFGVKTPALPLGIWVLMALTLGFISSLCLQLPNAFIATSPRPERLRDFSSEDEDFEPENPRGRSTREQSNPQSSYQQSDNQQFNYQSNYKENPTYSPPEISQNLSDWDIDFNEDWQDSAPDPEPRDSRVDSRVDPKEDFRGMPREDLKPDSRFDARENLRSEPRTPSNPPQDSRPPSTYAYGKGDEDNSGVGMTEAVYEANYRVINAPFSPPPAVAKQQEEDWGLEEEDDSVFDFPEIPETPEQGNSK
jgi:hypothetical protein